ncbi:MAG: hypothetical protein EDQ89_11780 [Acidobacteria bacterium]|nr:MAG: hypothetical protein EDQ89_11780 [Acidobacteriota bacterium]
MDGRPRQSTGRRPRRALWAALALTVGLLAGCGSGGDDTSSISEADLKEAVRDARQQERLKALQDEVDELRDDGGDSGDGPPESPGTPTTTDSGGEFAYTTYTDSLGGWTAEVPTGGGWSAPSASEQSTGLFSTRMQGPNGLFVVVHTTPSETPAFSGAPIDSRTTVTAPSFGTATKIVFQGNSNFPECEGGLCVDYLIPSGAGG